MLRQKTVYFREEDLPLWEKIGNKAQFLHDALWLASQSKDNKLPFHVMNIQAGINKPLGISPKYTPPKPTA